MKVIPFKAEHLEQMKKSSVPNYLDSEGAKNLEGDLAFTMIANGEVMMCAGAIEIWHGRYLAWAQVSANANGHWKSLHRIAKTFFKTLNASRVEADIDADFEEGKLWMEHIGFDCEIERRRKFFPDGRDAALYAMIGK